MICVGDFIQFNRTIESKIKIHIADVMGKWCDANLVPDVATTIVVVVVAAADRSNQNTFNPKVNTHTHSTPLTLASSWLGNMSICLF